MAGRGGESAAARHAHAGIPFSVEGAEGADLAEEGIVQRSEFGFRASVESVGRVRRHRGCASIALPGEQRDAARGAVREPVVSFEHRRDLVVLGQARGVDDREPVVEGLAACRRSPPAAACATPWDSCADSNIRQRCCKPSYFARINLSTDG